MNLAGKVALVTGAARGIGRGCALQLARAGADVVVNDRGPSAEVDSLVAEIRALSRRAAFVAADVFQRASCELLVEQAIAAFDRLDILVSNPAWSRRESFLEFPAETFRQTVAGTLVSGFDVSQLVARHFVARGGGGKIIFISSVHAHRPYVRSVAYNAAKAGLNHMARTIAAELLPYRINVNVIEPGWIDTPGEHASFGDDFVRTYGPKLPWGRIGTPEDIGKAAAYLASNAADYLTGSILRVDGGFVLRGALGEPLD